MIPLALVGIGGYGNSYVSALLDAPALNHDDFRIVGAIDPSPQACRRLGELRARGVPLYRCLEEFYARSEAALTVICSPLQFHAQQTVLALSCGSHVLCEKPLCVTPDQASKMIRARDAAGKQVAIGYQWSFSAAIQQLKLDILAGHLGRPRRLRSLVLWPRDEAYYRRNKWAGAKHDHDGTLVLDSPINNACAHHLHNLFYILGPRIDRSAQPALVAAELYRANAIENYDTAALSCITTDGTEIFLVTSHASAQRHGPIFSFEFERATVTLSNGMGEAIVATFTDGSSKSYGSPDEHKFEKLWSTIRAAREGTPTVCGIEAALAHMQCAFAAQQSMQQIRDFPPSLVRVDGAPGSRRTWVDGLDAQLRRCYDEFKLPSAIGFPWSARADEVVVAGHQPLSHVESFEVNHSMTR